VTNMTRRATVCLDPSLHRALRRRSDETSRSVSDLINDAVREQLARDAIDLAVFEERANERTVDLEEFAKGLERHDGM